MDVQASLSFPCYTYQNPINWRVYTSCILRIRCIVFESGFKRPTQYKAAIIPVLRPNKKSVFQVTGLKFKVG